MVVLWTVLHGVNPSMGPISDSSPVRFRVSCEPILSPLCPFSPFQSPKKPSRPKMCCGRVGSAFFDRQPWPASRILRQDF